MKTKFFPILLLSILTSFFAFSQESFTFDPVNNYRHFTEIYLPVSLTRINTNYAVCQSKQGEVNLQKANFLPSLDFVIHFGWIIKAKDMSVWMVKTGIGATSKAADLTDSTGKELRYTQSFIEVPLQIGFRIPLSNNKATNEYYNAVDYGLGVFVSIPCYEKLDDKNNLDSKTKSNFGSDMRFGMVSELAISSLRKECKGRKFGIRSTIDIPKIIKFRNNNYGISPYYYTISVFYCLANHYK